MRRDGETPAFELGFLMDLLRFRAALNSISKLTAEVFTSSLAGRSAMTQRPVFAGSVVPREPTEVAIMGFRNGL